MDAIPREIRFYEKANGNVPCREWLDATQAKNKKLHGTLINRLDRVQDGNLGDCHPVGGGVSELRIDVGPGYRIYFGEDGGLVVLLLGDLKGTKKAQKRNIKKAQQFWSDYNA